MALFFKESVRWGQLTLDPRLRLEVFRQGRVDRLRGSLLSDKLSTVILRVLGQILKLANTTFLLASIVVIRLLRVEH